MDGRGIMMGVMGKAKRVVTVRARTTFGVAADGNRENITILACVSGDGRVLPPALIY
jgi:hypothetical protein